jgi:phage terminase large subunit-like protein
MNKQTGSLSVSPAEKRQLVVTQANKNLIDFSIATDPAYQDTWFHETVAAYFQLALKQVEAGEDVRIILTVPPRHGKSELATKKFPAWTLGKHPEWPIAVASYSSELAVDFGQGTRDIMQSAAYREIFTTRLRPDTTAKGKWMTEQKGGYMAAGAGGAFTGKGFKVGIIDDLFKNREEAESKVIRDSRWDWYLSTFYTRQEGATAIIVIATRWHTDDIIGRLIAQQQEKEEEGAEFYDKWHIIEFPSIATHDEEFRIKGEALWPQKFPIEKLRKTESTLGPYEFAALYQCNPITSENQEFKPEWLKKRRWAEVEILETRKFATIDPGGKGEENDYTGITRNYVDKQNNWNLKSMRAHIDSKELINVVFQLHDEGFEQIGIEETVYTKAIEPFFKDECRKRNKFPNVIPLKAAERNKEVRIRGLIPRYASGSVFHIEGECKDLEDEMIVFPKGSHDDTLDSAAYQNDIAEAPLDEIAQARIRAQRAQRAEGVAKGYGLD